MSTTVYTIELENNKYYVGRSNSPEKRILSHFCDNGSEWTKLHKPTKVISKVKGDNFDEEKYTLIAMDKYGIDNVRGGSYCKVILTQGEKDKALQTIRSVSDKCYKCGNTGHFSKECKVHLTPLQKISTVSDKYYKCGNTKQYKKSGQNVDTSCEDFGGECIHYYETLCETCTQPFSDETDYNDISEISCHECCCLNCYKKHDKCVCRQYVDLLKTPIELEKHIRTTLGQTVFNPKHSQPHLRFNYHANDDKSKQNNKNIIKLFTKFYNKHHIIIDTYKGDITAVYKIPVEHYFMWEQMGGWDNQYNDNHEILNISNNSGYEDSGTIYNLMAIIYMVNNMEFNDTYTKICKDNGVEEEALLEPIVVSTETIEQLKPSFGIICNKCNKHIDPNCCEYMDHDYFYVTHYDGGDEWRQPSCVGCEKIIKKIVLSKQN